MELSRYSINSGLLGGQCNIPNQIDFDLGEITSMKIFSMSPQKFGLLLSDKDLILLHANPAPFFQ